MSICQLMMRCRLLSLFGLLAIATTACVDPYEPDFQPTVDVVVIDGTITDQAEPQLIRLNRSRVFSGQLGVQPLTKAIVEVIVDSMQIIATQETEPGSYQLPPDFRGRVGHRYQVRFTLSNGAQYLSTGQTMLAVPPISATRAQFNPTSLGTNQFGGQVGGHDVFLDTQDPVDGPNYYQWEWNLYEKQTWCRTCNQGVYAVNAILPGVFVNSAFVSGETPYEDCFIPNSFDYGGAGEPQVPGGVWYYDYQCRTQCWAIIHSNVLNLFADQYSNGGVIANRKVAQIPYYTRQPALVELRQLSLTPDAYSYFKRFQDQTQNTGGIADTPPTVSVGNVRNLANPREIVVGYFTASAVSTRSHWLDRKDATGLPVGGYDQAGNPIDTDQELFYALNSRLPYPEPSPPYTGGREAPKVLIVGGPARPPTALCVLTDSSTPVKPTGWRE